MSDVQSVTIAMPTGEAPAGHDAAMAAKVDAADAAAASAAATGSPAPGTSAARPENVPEKFWDAEKGAINTEALLKSYTDLESAHSKAAATKIIDADTVADAAKQAAVAPIDADKLTAEILENGALSEESYASLEKAGVPRETADRYIAGQQALFQLLEAKVHEVTGGPDAFESMKAWAKANLPREAVTAFNKAVVSPSQEQVLLAVSGLKAKYDAANGKTPNLVNGEGGGPLTNTFNSWQEVQTAMKDPRYGSDPHYTQQLADKLGRSQI